MTADQNTIGEKFDTEKPDWSLVPWEAMAEVVEVLTFGADKYERDNWRHVENWEKRYFAATMRHLTDWMSGKTIDPETDKNALAHVACCILFMLAKDLEQDDGFLDIDAQPLITPFQAHVIGTVIKRALEHTDEQLPNAS